MKKMSCGALRASDAGKTVELMGWVHTIRDHKDTFFIDLRDWEGITQIVTHKSKLKQETIEKLNKITRESSVKIIGLVKKRPAGTENKDLPTGEIEIEIKDVDILNICQPLPYHFKDETTALPIKLKYRYIDLRNPSTQKNLIMRSKITSDVRKYFEELGFIEVETPCLTRSTAEGARAYLVPSRVHKGKFYALPQSPQLFKQMLMCSGIEKYYQIARCFRDEDLRPERQPEFTQIDLEMSYIEREDIMNVIEGLLVRLWDKFLGIKLKQPFKRMSYQEAMDRFGSDKPDTRFGWELKNITDLIPKDTKIFKDVFEKNGMICAICAEGYGDASNNDIAKIRRYVQTDFKAKDVATIAIKGGIKTGLTKYIPQEVIDKIIKKMGAKENSMIFIIGDANKDIVYNSLGQLRLTLAKEKKIIPENQFNFLWIIDFPMFEWDSEERRWVAKHHPFTSPTKEWLDKFDTDQEHTMANSYDIVLNGYELGGGSIRNYNPEIQERMFKAIGFTPEYAKQCFEFLIDALKYGAPPHGGIALGLDRLVMIMLGADNIRDVIAFPKLSNAVLPLDNSPGVVLPEQLETLGIQLKPEIQQLLEKEEADNKKEALKTN